VVPGEEQVPQTQLAGLGLELLHDGGVCLPSLFALAELRLEERLRGDAFLFDEFLDLVFFVYRCIKSAKASWETVSGAIA